MEQIRLTTDPFTYGNMEYNDKNNKYNKMI